MDLQLAGRRALVTGSSAGLGEAIVMFLAAEGASVVVHGRNEARARAVETAIRESGGDVAVVLGDLTEDDGPALVCEAALAGGPIDILVNNAGEYSHRSWTDATKDDWLDAYQVNVVAGVLLVQGLLPQMLERDGAGSSRSAGAWPSSHWRATPTTVLRWRRATISPCRWLVS